MADPAPPARPPSPPPPHAPSSLNVTNNSSDDDGDDDTDLSPNSEASSSSDVVLASPRPDQSTAVQPVDAEREELEHEPEDMTTQTMIQTPEIAGIVPMQTILEDPSRPPIGQIYLPGQPLVSSQHRALDRYTQWEQENAMHLRGVDMRTRWKYYISKRDVSLLTSRTPRGDDSPGGSRSPGPSQAQGS